MESKDEAHLRRVQITGGGSHVIALPKSWIKSVGLKPKDIVAIIEQPDECLLLSPRRVIRSGKLSEVNLHVPPSAKKEVVVRDCIANYLAGYDVIRIHSSAYNPELRSYVKETIRKNMMATEIIEETHDMIAFQYLSGYAELSLKNALERMLIITSSMQKDSMKALSEGDKLLAAEVIQRDDEVDRFYHYIMRQLKTAVENRSIIQDAGLTSPAECLWFMMIVKSVERAGDHAAKIAMIAKDLKPTKIEMEKIIEIGHLSNSVFEQAMRSLFKQDSKLAHETIDKAETFMRLEENVTKGLLSHHLETKTILGLKLSVQSLRRIAEYAADIAEVVINITTMAPSK